ncbi:amino acid/amide ABC transporter ATP-binding protein 2, HAAT family [Halorientalis persicus]|jgi:branched-chain amino acid transport system ATP-binding protein|uniref:Amino acid/amide ABC transporter ATP-binding protein 2, HAAT family n=1 Tax=Halorientalis persicus TaxID=1367881 RepID=A0A1H8PIY5_9EURY|nr:ABC transporter ATP-binding protein [Halorientalis persicus]SEO41684.1 amino acid/amide ABC transporter ATP-binding protein 2, HAAT family [Halorientalis persicus]
MSADTPQQTSRSEASPPVLRAEGIVTGYGDHEVIHDVDIQSHEGITCLFGPNGSGKSTLLKTLNGIVPIWEGTITYGDVDLSNATPDEIVREGIATVPQGGGVFGTLTVEENLRVGGFTVSEQDAYRRRREEVLDAFPALEDKLGDRASSLSGGQQMMVSLGRAMMTGADTFLLDEPSAGLSPALVEDAFELVERLVDRGARVILIEQNVTAALRLADHVNILVAGELAFDGSPAELSDEEELMEVYLGL